MTGRTLRVPSATEPVRAWQRMLSGRRLDLLDPSPADIELADIAHGLARVARWNGQTFGTHVFSVAQHSLFVEAIAAELDPRIGREARLAALLHDAPEYVIGDLITPLKSVLGTGYANVEARLLAAIHRRFGVTDAVAARALRLVKRADRVAACLEAQRLAGFSPDEVRDVFGEPELLPDCAVAYLVPWPTAKAARDFAARVAVLGVDTARPSHASPETRGAATSASPCQARSEHG